MVTKLLRNFRFSLLQRQVHTSRPTNAPPARLRFLVPMSRLCAPIPPRSCLPRTMNVNVSPTGYERRPFAIAWCPGTTMSSLVAPFH
jgi:hypothetical protein